MQIQICSHNQSDNFRLTMPKSVTSHSMVTNVTYVKSIAVLNSDGTFDIYQQAKED